MTHTEGPWEVWTITDTGLPGIVAHNGPTVAEVTKWTSAGNSNPEVMQANARLIASAPELLEALDALLWAAAEKTLKQKEEVWEQARRAIARANGE